MIKCQKLRRTLGYFTTSDYNKFTCDMLGEQTEKKGLVNKFNLCNLVRNYQLNTKFATLATKAELKAKTKLDKIF